MARVEWTLEARRDFARAIENAEVRYRGYGERIASEMAIAIENLESFPRIGRMVTRFQSDRVREVIVLNFRLVYRLEEDDDIEIVAFLNSIRDNPI